MGKILIGVIIVAAVAGFFLMREDPKGAEEMMQQGAEVMKGGLKEQGAKVMDKATEAVGSAVENAKERNGAVKEVNMTSYYDDKGVWFSVKEIKVKKGDLVRVKVTNTKGTHDFVLDEFGVKLETPVNEEVVAEFVADKVGSFEYYCSKPGHKARGQWGTLIVE